MPKSLQDFTILKTSKNFNKDKLIPLLKEKIKDHKDIFVICRSLIADISFDQIIEELGNVLKHCKSIMSTIRLKKNIMMVKQKEAH